MELPDDPRPPVAVSVVAPAAASGAPDALPPAVAFRSVTTYDVDDQAAALDGWEQRYHQLSPGSFVGEIDQGSVGESFSFFFEHSNRRVAQSVAGPEGRHTFALLRCDKGDARVGDRRLGGDCLLAAPPRQAFDVELPEDATIDALSVGSDELLSYAEIVIDDEGRREAGFDQISLRSNPLASLFRGFCEQVRSACADPALVDLHPQTRHAMRSAAISNILFIISSQRGRGAGGFVVADRRYRLVQQARDLLEADVPTVYTVADLCRALGVSRRTLQYCFEDVLQINPIAYIRAMRLNAVRRELRQAMPGETCVADIAARHGFWHLSHFSADYRRMFGELPSATLARSTRH